MNEEAGLQKPHFVLVHGACHGAWCWYKIRCLMETSGYKVTCLDLKSAGIDQSNPNTILTLDEYDAPLIDFLSNLPHDEKVILVGHSAGGLSLTDAIHRFPKRIHLAIYVAANMLKHGFSSDQDFKDGDPDVSEYGEIADLEYGMGLDQPPTSLIIKEEFQKRILYQPKQTISLPHSFRLSVSTMDLSLAASPSSFDLLLLNSHKFSLFQSNPDFSLKSKKPPTKSLFWRQNRPFRARALNDDGFVLEDVPHLTDFLPHLPSYPNPLHHSHAYAIVKQTFVGPEDAVAQNIVVHKDSPRGVHLRRAGPREKVYFMPEEVRACIVTCGGLCPGINTVIREIVCGLNYMYGVDDVLGILGGYRGFYSKNTINLTPKVVNDIHKRGGTFLCTSRGGHDTNKIVDNIQDRRINQVYIIGGDGTQRGAALIYKEVEKRGLQVAVAGIPKTIDNDIAVIDKSFGFDTAVEEAQRAINAAHVEVESVENGVGIVKLMGRYSGFIAMFATLASRDVDCCLIPESPFYLEGPGGLFEFIEQRIKENGHMVIVIAEGAGQEYVAQAMQAADERDASGNRLLLDVGLWLTQKVKDHFTKVKKMEINMKYIDPTYMIRAIPSNASDNIYCSLLAQSAVHGAMAGYTGFTVGPVNSRHAYIPIARVTEAPNTVKVTDRMWARLLASTNQPSFLNSNEMLPM